MSGMAEVLNVHHDWAFSLERGEVLCVGCDWSQQVGLIDPAAEVFRAHQAAMLTAAGFGPVKEARAVALEEAAAIFAGRLPDGTGNGRAYNSYQVADMLRARAAKIRASVA